MRNQVKSLKHDNVYGFELILDLHGCSTSTFTRRSLRAYFKKLCDAIDMQRCKLVFWDDVGVPEDEKQISAHTKGTSGSRGGKQRGRALTYNFLIDYLRHNG